MYCHWRAGRTIGGSRLSIVLWCVRSGGRSTIGKGRCSGTRSERSLRDIEDDLRFFAWESLKGSVRFKVALEALKLVAERYGSSNVCVAGHSLGAGFAIQVGKTLAKEGIYVD